MTLPSGYALGPLNMDRTVYRTSESTQAEALSAGETTSGPAGRPPHVRRVENATLFERGREVVIVHHGQEYRLRITKSDKLILTK
jgi:hemin uptake protein HemP